MFQILSLAEKLSERWFSSYNNEKEIYFLSSLLRLRIQMQQYKMALFIW